MEINRWNFVFIFPEATPAVVNQIKNKHKNNSNTYLED